MTETNFKHTDLGLIPHDWEVKTLEESTQRVSVGLATSVTKYYSRTGVPMFRNLNIKENRLDDSDILYLDETFANANPTKKIHKDDVLTVHTGYVGISCVVPEKYEGALTFTTLITTTKRDLLSPNYLSLYLNSNMGMNEVSLLQAGGGRNNLNVNDFINLRITLPPTLAEQERIAGALSSIDTLIGALTEQIEKKRHIKQGAMQQLLTGKKRLAGFTGEWKSVKLDDLLAYEQPTRYLVQSTEYTEQGTPVLTAGKTFILGYTTEGCGIFDKLPVIIFDDFVVESKYVTFPFKVKSSAMKMLSLRDKVNNLRFIYEKMQCIDFPIADHKRHWISEYSQIEITLPEPAEQSAIAAVLSRMDTEIAALEQKRDKYIAIKSGMMQNLLTGKIRLV